MMLNKSPRELVRMAFEGLFDHHLFYGSLASRWEIVECGEIPTFATNGRQLFFNPKFVSEGTGLKPPGALSLAEIEWVLLHEAEHDALGHHVRLPDADPMEKNVACDLALDHLIEKLCPSERLRNALCFPGHGHFSALPGNKEAEWYHRELYANKPQAPEPEPGEGDDSQESVDEGESEGNESSGEGDEGEENDRGDGGSESGSEESESDSGGSESGSGESESGSEGSEGEGEGDAEGDGSAKSDGDGSGGGAGKPGEGGEGEEGGEAGADAPEGKAKGLGDPSKGAAEPGSIGQVLPDPKIDGSPEKQAAAEAEWREAIADAVAVSRMAGNLPGWLYQRCEQVLGKSEIDWRLVLRRFMTKAIPQGYSYAKPNRRSCWRKDVILPAHRGKGGGKGLIIADTSGSMFGSLNAKVLPEIEKILRSIPKCEVTVVDADTMVRHEKKFDQYSFPLRVPVEWKGGGGTDLSPAFIEAAKRRGEFKWVVIITDMYWSWQSAPNPGIPVLWLVVNNPGFDQKVPFGDLVKAKV